MCCWAVFCDSVPPGIMPKWLDFYYSLLLEIKAPSFFSFLKIAPMLQFLKHCLKLVDAWQALVNSSWKIFFISFFISYHSPGNTKRREKSLLGFCFCRPWNWPKDLYNLICCWSFPVLVDVPVVSLCFVLVSVCFRKMVLESLLRHLYQSCFCLRLLNNIGIILLICEQIFISWRI